MLLGLPFQCSWSRAGSGSGSIAENAAALCLLAVEHGLKVSVPVLCLSKPLCRTILCYFLSVIFSVCAVVVLALSGFFGFALICLSIPLEYNLFILLRLSCCYLRTEPFAFHLEQRVCWMVVPAPLCHLPCWAPAVRPCVLRLNYCLVPYWPILGSWTLESRGAFLCRTRSSGLSHSVSWGLAQYVHWMVLPLAREYLKSWH